MSALATHHQKQRFISRLKTPGQWLQQIPHVLLGALCWLPPVLAFVLWREIAQAATGDGEGRPSATTGWLDPLFDLAFYVLGSCAILGLALWFYF